MKKTGKLNAISPTNSRRQSKHVNSGRGTVHVNSGRRNTNISNTCANKNNCKQTVYKTNLNKYTWICKRALKNGLLCAISESVGKKVAAEQIHHVFPRLRAPQYIYNENYLIPLTCIHHSLVENEIEKLDWENQEVIIDGIRHKLDLSKFRETWKQLRLEYEDKYEKDGIKNNLEEDKF